LFEICILTPWFGETTVGAVLSVDRRQNKGNLRAHIVLLAWLNLAGETTGGLRVITTLNAPDVATIESNLCGEEKVTARRMPPEH